MSLDYIFPSDPSQIRELARSARALADTHFKPTSSDDPVFRRENFAALADQGFAGAASKEQFGGADLTPLEISALIFELARQELGIAVTLSVHLMVSKLIENFDRVDAHRDVLKSLASGSSLAAFALTEAGAGSDAASIQTKATRTKDGYVLEGEKIFITNAGLADIYLVFARTSNNSDTPKRALSAFLVSGNAASMSFGPHERKMGCSSAPIAPMRFDKVEVKQSARLGEEGEGYAIALSGLNGGRVNIAAAACGIASTALQRSIEYSQTRKQFGKPIGEFQGLQFMLADMYTKFRSSILLTRDAAITLNTDPRNQLAASTAKAVSTDAAMSITTDAVQIHGGAGYIQDVGIERLMRDAKMLQIVEGTNQIQRNLIARALKA